MIGRRHLLQLGAAAGLTAAAPRIAFAQAATEKRFILILLRGGLDGLHALPPYADRDYQRLRPGLALGAPGSERAAVDLDGYFGLHPALAPLLAFYRQGELAIIPAATTVYRDRSHFDGQNLLENGSGVAFGAKDGWLNRAIAALPGAADNPLGLALGPSVPLLMQGPAQVMTWADSALPPVDEDFLARLAHTYRQDALFAATLAEARGRDVQPDMDSMEQGGDRRGRDFVKLATAAADLLARGDGPRLAMMESGGWDTHFGQNRRLGILLDELAQGLTALHQGLGPAWRDTAVLVVSEFGRTVQQNGSGGTDHGTGGIAFLLGGAVRGGLRTANWPGLTGRALLDGRDLAPVNSYEAIFKAVLQAHLGVPDNAIEDTIFPNSRGIRPALDLFV